MIQLTKELTIATSQASLPCESPTGCRADGPETNSLGCCTAGFWACCSSVFVNGCGLLLFDASPADFEPGTINPCPELRKSVVRNSRRPMVVKKGGLTD
jgi:hypothetical protein